MTTIRVLGVTGSLRKASFNTAALRAAQELLSDGMAMDIYVPDDLPLYNGDVEKLGIPASVQRFHRAIRDADALIFATPEYNYSITGVLKNAIDWGTRPPGQSALRGKPAAIMGVTTGIFGTLRAQLHLREILLHEVNKPQILIGAARQKFEDGRLVDEETREFIRQMLVNLRELVDNKRVLEQARV